MNERSFTYPSPMPATAELSTDRRAQILAAAMKCFSLRGFHQTSMLDLSAEAGISVGLIYRYFASKEAVIAAMAEEHKREFEELFERAQTAPTVLDSLEILLTSHCTKGTPQMHAAFVIDLFAEAGRNPAIAASVGGVLETLRRGMTGLVSRVPEMRTAAHGLEPSEIADLILATARGSMMRDVLERQNITLEECRHRQLRVVRHLWTLLAPPQPAFA